jgi:DNA-binding HxlR family transcriptional regulator
MTRSAAPRFGCAVELTLTLLGGKWKPVILAHLKQTPRPYAELRRLVPRLSDKMLTQRLRDLREQGLVEKSGDPPRLRYQLTARGRSLAPVLQAMHDWGQRMAGPLGAILEPAQASGTARD